MNYCSNCGEELEGDEAYCRKCGEQLKRQPQQTERQQPQQSTPDQNHTETTLAAQALGVISAIIMAGGATLPWLTISAVGIELGELAGTDFRIGGIIIAAGVVTLLVMAMPWTGAHIIAGGIATMVGLFTVVFINDPLAFQPNVSGLERAVTDEVTQTSAGVYVTLAGALGVIVAAVVSLTD